VIWLPCSNQTPRPDCWRDRLSASRAHARLGRLTTSPSASTRVVDGLERLHDVDAVVCPSHATCTAAAKDNDIVPSSPLGRARVRAFRITTHAFPTSRLDNVRKGREPGVCHYRAGTTPSTLHQHSIIPSITRPWGTAKGKKKATLLEGTTAAGQARIPPSRRRRPRPPGRAGPHTSAPGAASTARGPAGAAPRSWASEAVLPSYAMPPWSRGARRRRSARPANWRRTASSVHRSVNRASARRASMAGFWSRWASIPALRTSARPRCGSCRYVLIKAASCLKLTCSRSNAAWLRSGRASTTTKIRGPSTSWLR
jgi:hypothetical protein